MLHTSATTFVTALAIRHSLAGGWAGAAIFPCPNNTNTQCSPAQQVGYDWSNLPTDDFSSYGNNSFSGFSYSGKQDLLNMYSFTNKPITANLDDSPSMSCGTESSFSINRIEMSSSHDAEVECHYDMSDGSTCKETHTCLRSGSIFPNNQCGGGFDSPIRLWLSRIQYCIG